MRFAPLVALLALGLTSASAQPVIDGDLTDPQYTLLADNAGGPERGFGSENNLNALYAYAADDVLYLGIAGSVNLDGGGDNRIVIFLDTRSGGFGTGNYAAGSSSGGSNAINNFNAGSSFDPGFEADFALEIRTNGTRSDYLVELVELSGTRGSGMSMSRSLGSAASSANIAAILDTGASQTTQGFEIAIPYAAVTSPTGAALAVTEPTIQSFSLLSGANGFLSNLFLSRAGPFDGNYGNGAVTFGAATPDPLSYTLPILTSATAGYRLLSVPGTARTVDDLAALNLVSGAGGYTVGTNCAAITNLFTGYTGDETAPNGGYTAPATGGTQIQPGAGFFWYLFGDGNPNAAFPTQCDAATAGDPSVTRALPFGLPYAPLASEANATVAVSGRAAGDDAFFLGGNPFTQGFDLEGGATGLTSITATGGASFSNVVQAYNPAGGYVLFTADSDGGDDGSGGSSTADDVSVWQGFFLEATDPADAVTEIVYAAAFRTGTSDAGSFVGRQGRTSALAQIRLALSGTLAGGGTVADDAIGVVFAPGAHTGWDAYDASKLEPFSATYAEVALMGAGRDGLPTAKASESRDLGVADPVVVPARFTASDDGTFELSWAGGALPAGWSAALRDLETGATSDLTAAGTYGFSAEAGTSARFEIEVAPLLVAGEAGPETGTVTAPQPNPSAGTATMRVTTDRPQAVRVEAFDLLGRRVATVYDGPVEGTRTLTIDASALAPGVYVLRTTGETFAATRRFVVTR